MTYPNIYTIDPLYLTEGESGVGSIRRTNATQNKVVYVSTSPGSAVVGDYGNSFQTLTFPAGVNEIFFSVLTIDDNRAEGTESFTVFLTESYGGAPLAQSIVTIADNDYAPVAPVTQVTPSPAMPFSGGTVIYTDNSVTNYNYIDNSTNVTNYNIVTTTTYNGSSRSDKLQGSDSNDNLTGLGGNDTLNGLAGDDIISGGVGNDRIYGGTGMNDLSGGTGRDRYYLTAEGQESKADIIRDLNVGDRIFIQGATRQGLTVNETRGGVGIFNNGVLEALYTGNALSLGQVSNMITAA